MKHPRKPLYERPAPIGKPQRAADLQAAKARIGKAAVEACQVRFPGKPSLYRNLNRAKCVQAKARQASKR